MKDTRAAVLILILLVSFGSLFQNAFHHNSFPLFPSAVKAQSQFTITTDRPVYNVGETVTIYIQPAIPAIGASYWLTITGPDKTVQSRIDLGGGQTTASNQAGLPGINGAQTGQFEVDLWGQPVAPNTTASILASTTYFVGQMTTTPSPCPQHVVYVSVSTTKPVYSVGDEIVALWNPAMSGSGQLSLNGPSGSYQFTVDLSQGQYDIGQAEQKDVGSWTATLTIPGPQGCPPQGQGSTTFQVGQSSPDLIAVSCGTLPDSPKVGDSVRFWVDFKILGGTPPFIFNYQMFLDGNLMQTLPTSPVEFGSAARAGNSITTDTTWTVTSGSHTVRWVLNPDHMLQESDYSNNEVSCSFNVGQTPSVTLVKVRATVLDVSMFDKAGFFIAQIVKDGILDDPTKRLKQGDRIEVDPGDCMPISDHPECKVDWPLNQGDKIEVYGRVQFPPDVDPNFNLVAGLWVSAFPQYLKLETILDVPYDWQSATNWCGLASLAMILNYYGIQKHSWDIAKELGLSSKTGMVEGDGLATEVLRLFGIVESGVPAPKPSDYIANYYPDLRVKAGYYDTTDEIRQQIKQNIQLGYPVMLNLRKPGGGGHFVVVVGFDKTGLFVNDPSGALIIDWLGGQEPLIGAYVSWDRISTFLITTKSFPAPFGRVASMVVVQGNPNPLGGKLAIGSCSETLSCMVYGDHGQFHSYPHDVSIYMDWGLVWRGREEGIFVKHAPWWDSADFLGPNIRVYNQYDDIRSFALSVRITGSDSTVYFDQTTSITVQPHAYSQFAYGLKLESLKLNQDLMYTVRYRLLDSDGTLVDSVDLPAVPFSDSGSAVSMRETQGHLHLHVYDSQGRHTGFNYQTNTVELGIPGSWYVEYSDGLTVVFLPKGVQTFRFVVDARSATQSVESYDVVVSPVDRGNPFSSQVYSGSINKGETKEYNVEVSGGRPPWEEYITLLLPVVVVAILLASIFVLRGRRPPKVLEVSDAPRIQP